LQDQWAEIGVDAQLQILDFNLLVDQLTGQTYDAIGIFWGFNVPDNPDVELTDTFLPGADVLGSGFNTTSYNNPIVNEVTEKARTLPGCDVEERAALYKQAFAELNNDLPWLWISTSTVMSAAQADLENWEPLPGSSRWNLDGWAKETG
jgi:ABC-type transport system substrate-binding protein